MGAKGCIVKEADMGAVGEGAVGRLELGTLGPVGSVSSLAWALEKFGWGWGKGGRG